VSRRTVIISALSLVFITSIMIVLHGCSNERKSAKDSQGQRYEYLNVGKASLKDQTSQPTSPKPTPVAPQQVSPRRHGMLKIHEPWPCAPIPQEVCKIDVVMDNGTMSTSDLKALRSIPLYD